MRAGYRRYGPAMAGTGSASQKAAEVYGRARPAKPPGLGGCENGLSISWQGIEGTDRAIGGPASAFAGKFGATGALGNEITGLARR